MDTYKNEQSEKRRFETTDVKLPEMNHKFVIMHMCEETYSYLRRIWYRVVIRF